MVGWKRYASLITFYLIVFFDLMARTIGIILFATLLISQESPLVRAEVGLEVRHALYWLLVGLHVFVEFVMAPVWGGISDRVGRRRILLITTCVAFLSWLLLGIGMTFGSLAILIVGRAFTGFAAGNLPLVQAAITDMTNTKNRGRYMSVFSMLTGAAWVAGPLIGGFLSDSSLVSWFGPPIPFWTMSLLFGLIFLSTVCFVSETQFKRDPEVGFLTMVRSFKRMFRIPHVRRLFLTMTAMVSGKILFIYFFGIYLTERYELSTLLVNEAFVYVAIWIILGGLLANLLYRYIAPRTLVIIPMFALAFACLAFLPFDDPRHLLWIIPIAGVSQALVAISFFTLLANAVEPDMRGKIFGAWGSMRSAIYIVIPLVALWLALVWINLPNLLGGILVLATAVWYLVRYVKGGCDVSR